MNGNTLNSQHRRQNKDFVVMRVSQAKGSPGTYLINRPAQDPASQVLSSSTESLEEPGN